MSLFATATSDGRTADLASARVERIASTLIGVLLAALSLATIATAIVGLALHQSPDSSNASLIISASALACMVLIWLPKRYLAKALNSNAMQGEATCSLSCIQITIALFTGSLVYRLWKGGWWVDSATALVLGGLFGWEGYKMLRWAGDPAFNGGCCRSCADVPVPDELAETYRDLCGCCAEKDDCKARGKCICGEPVSWWFSLRSYSDCWSSQVPCCSPVSNDGTQCCSHKILERAVRSEVRHSDSRQKSFYPHWRYLKVRTHNTGTMAPGSMIAVSSAYSHEVFWPTLHSSARPNVAEHQPSRSCPHADR